MARKSGSKKNKAKVVSSKTVYRGPVFTVTTDYVREPGIDKPLRRDMVRHQGSVVVLAVDFMGAVFAGNQNLLEYGAGIALPIAALGVFLGLRAWAARQSHARDRAANDHPPGD